MVPGGIDFYSEQEAEGSDGAVQWDHIKFVICFLSGRWLNLRFIGMGCGWERQQGFIGDLVRDHTCAPPFIRPIRAPSDRK